MNNLTVYTKSYASAVKENKVELYKESKRLNFACKEKLDELISANYDMNTWCLNSERVLKDAIHEFGINRVHYILRCTILAHDKDGRISPENLSWATQSVSSQPEKDNGLSLSAHPGLVNLLVSALRDMEKKLSFYPSEEYKEQLHRKYPVGATIKLIRMSGESLLPPGTIGTVTNIDDIGQIQVCWKNPNSSLALLEPIDEFEIINPESEKESRV